MDGQMTFLIADASSWIEPSLIIQIFQELSRSTQGNGGCTHDVSGIMIVEKAWYCLGI